MRIGNSRQTIGHCPARIVTDRERRRFLWIEPESAGMKFDDLIEMCEKILQAMVPGIRAVLVLHSLFLQLLVEHGRTFFEAVIVFLAAVEIDGELAQ